MGFLILLFITLLWMSAVMDAIKAKQASEQKKQDALRGKENTAEFVVEEKPKEKDFVVEDVKKFCPPHKWRYQEVRDPEGNVIRHRIICDLCGPLKPADGPARLG